MFGLEPWMLVLVAGLLVLLEIPLCWAAAALADTPPMSFGKLILVAVGVTLLWAVGSGFVGWALGLHQLPLPEEKRLLAYLVLGASIVLMWVVPAVLYTPLLPTSLSKSMRMALFQVLLRGFAYALLAAFTFVGLAIWQIVTKVDVRMILLP